MIYDVVVIGGGPAGLSSAIYSARAKMKTLVLEKETVGGQIKITEELVNYPGIEQITGSEYMNLLKKQAKNFGVEFKEEEVLDLELDSDVKTIKAKYSDIKARSIIIATGASPKKLGFKGEDEFMGRGVAYCATCDGQFFEGLEIFVIGGGFAAAEEAIFLTKYAKKVIIVVRKDKFSCAQSIVDHVNENPKIEVWYNTELNEISGDGVISQAIFKNNKTGEIITYNADEEDTTFGVFVFIGYKPETNLVKDKVKLDEQGYIITDENMKTNIEGVYAAGDLRPKELRQVVTAVADGAIASVSAQKYVLDQKHRLGIKEDFTPVNKEVVKQETKPKVEVDTTDTNKKSKLLTDELRAQIKQILSLMQKDVTLVSIIDENNDKSIEFMDLILDMASLGDKLHTKIYKKSENIEVEKMINANKYPVVALLDDKGEYSKIKYHGVPGGHELNSFILAIYNLAGPGQALDENIIKEIKSIDKNVNIKVMISLSCTLCPDVVVASQRIACENRNVEAEMIDIGLFPDLKKEHKIMSVPAILINDSELYFGAKKISELIELIKK